MNIAAIQWLQARFDLAMELRRRNRYFYLTLPGPHAVRPVIELLSIMDAGEPMRIGFIEYMDPERMWL